MLGDRTSVRWRYGAGISEPKAQPKSSGASDRERVWNVKENLLKDIFNVYWLGKAQFNICLRKW